MSNSRGQQLILDSMDTCKILLSRYGITGQDRDQAQRLMRERATSEDLDAYVTAIKTLFGNGGLG